MTFKEWLEYAVKHRSADMKQLLPELKLNDGTQLSVQASEFHMCKPQKKLTNGDYDEIEVYTHGVIIKELTLLNPTSPFVYGYVNTNYMDLICRNHGGICEPKRTNDDVQINNNISYQGKEIRKWCNDYLHDIPAAAHIYEKYYSDKAKFKPNDHVYYFIEYISSAESYKTCGNLKLEGYRLYRDLDKSPRKTK